jgi:hypothetical protein
MGVHFSTSRDNDYTLHKHIQNLSPLTEQRLFVEQYMQTRQIWFLVYVLTPENSR